jgi:nucleotide-binding universal stress UspA family protein
VEKEGPEEVLVAHDLTDVGYAGLEWGVELMRRDKLHLHVLHCLEPEDFFGFMSATSSEILDKEISSRRERVEQDLARLGVDESARVSIKVGPPQVEIYNYLSKHSIDLLIMGTLARSGVSAMITGNTAETLLPWVRCSLLALKPSTFVSPVPKSVSE